MHREHHLKPQLTWLELLPSVESAPGPFWARLLPLRDIRQAVEPR